WTSRSLTARSSRRTALSSVAVPAWWSYRSLRSWFARCAVRSGCTAFTGWTLWSAWPWWSLWSFRSFARTLVRISFKHLWWRNSHETWRPYVSHEAINAVCTISAWLSRRTWWTTLAGAATTKHLTMLPFTVFLKRFRVCGNHGSA
uniref:Uncharacterized protein n=1 Tax=Parascaris univalens TaxID=6257 RepID=A0A915B355_PARUN